MLETEREVIENFVDQSLRKETDQSRLSKDEDEDEEFKTIASDDLNENKRDNDLSR